MMIWGEALVVMTMFEDVIEPPYPRLIFFCKSEIVPRIALTKLGVPNRWDWTVMLRGIAGEEQSASYTSVPTVLIPQLGKTTCPNTYVHTRARSRSRVLTVSIVQLPKITWDNTFVHTLVRNLTLVYFVHTRLLIDLHYSFIWQSM